MLLLNKTCQNNNIVINPIWIPREANKAADFYSRILDLDDWSVKRK